MNPKKFNQVHAKMGELLKYFELNKKFPDDRKLDYNTLAYAWAMYGLVVGNEDGGQEK
jgi:hypothetical protein